VDRPREPLPTRVEDTPPLPAAYADALAEGLAALGLTLTAGARAAIDGQARLLLAWTGAINLTAIRDPAAVAQAHVVDSLTALPTLRERGVERFLDLGSGGGYPGLPLAAALPAKQALLVEPIRKKAAFLATATTAIGLQDAVTAAAVRAEALAADTRHRGRWPAVTARAVASLGELVELAFPLLRPGGILVAWKRDDLEGEWAAAERAAAVLGGGTLERRPVSAPGLAGHVLVIATAMGSAPAIYPRDPGARRRRPW
jgi:16S rRNA (guanine527-N7)-methyltransferase